eukprot:1149671-Pelagomonas_calceolata.AAC.4
MNREAAYGSAPHFLVILRITPYLFLGLDPSQCTSASYSHQSILQKISFSEPKQVLPAALAQHGKAPPSFPCKWPLHLVKQPWAEGMALYSPMLLNG